MSRKNVMDVTDCPVTYALNMIGGKWNLPIIWALSQSPVLRYNEIDELAKWGARQMAALHTGHNGSHSE